MIWDNACSSYPCFELTSGFFKKVPIKKGSRGQEK